MRPLLIVLTFVLLGCARQPDRSAPPERQLGHLSHVGAPEFKALAEQKNGLFLDVRTPGEVARGHLPGATVIDINDAKFEQRLGLLQKDRPIFVYCASGGRSSAAAEMMIRSGFTDVYELSGGIGGWVRAGYPLEREDSAAPAAGSGLTPGAFDELLKNQRRVLVDFSTPWCTPCRKMAPTVEALTEAWKGRVHVVRVDLEQSEALAARQKVESVPTFVLYVDGKERWRRTGELSRDVIEAELARP